MDHLQYLVAILYLAYPYLNVQHGGTVGSIAILQLQGSILVQS